VIGLGDCVHYGIELIEEFGMVSSDLVLPDPGWQHDLVAFWVDDGRSTGLLARHCRQAVVRLGRAAW